MLPRETSASPSRREFLLQGGAAALAVGAWGAAGSPSLAAGGTPQEQAEKFIAEYLKGFLPLSTASSEAEWIASTDISDAHTAESVKRRVAASEFAGSKHVIETTQALLAKRSALEPKTVLELERILLRAAESPATVPEITRARIEAEAAQSDALYAYTFTLAAPGEGPVPLSPNDIDETLEQSKSLPVRRAVWESSKAVGGKLRDGLLKLRDLRNKTAQALGYDNYFALQVADYGLGVPEMMELCDGFVQQVRPLYEQLHAWAKHTLAARYGVDPPAGPIPAHWLPNRWAQNWPGLVEAIDLDGPFAGKPKEFVIEKSEAFYVSLGLPKLPPSFYEKSDLYPAEPGSGRSKNTHASAWHIDLEHDVRSLMSIQPNSRWFTTAHHELGHVYYFLGYSRPEVSPLLRAGANRAFHEGIGDLIGLAVSQPGYLEALGLLPPEAPKPDSVLWLLEPALAGASIVFTPFAAGTMTHFERDLYEGRISDDKLNAHWWELVGRFQGVAPPGPRPETLCDAATKTHINDDAAQYYDYALGTVIKYQLHDHIARRILKQDPRNCNYLGNKEVGRYLGELFALGATRDWREVLQQFTGGGLSAGPMVSYFAPLKAWLEEQNKGRAIGWT
jgi:peptidyl-dipeptidase A